MVVEPVPSGGFDRVPPHNLEAEESVLGSMVLSHAAVAEAQDVVIAEDFYKDSHRKIYQALVELYAAGKTTDPVVLAEELKRLTGMKRAFFCNSGAESVEAALKLSRRATGKSKVVAAERCFHGPALTPTRPLPLFPALNDSYLVPYNDPEALKTAVTKIRAP
jgi:hypothetical protein